MKRKKGFTLIELLASIVLLGILFWLGIPLLTGTITRSRDKMYVTDARKLVSKVEYKLKAASTTIEKPDPGNCIAVSLGYLDDKDFQISPYEGEYVEDASFVIVKNTNTGLEYSVELVEKLKSGGYKGIALVKSSALQESNAVKYVKGINESDLIHIEKNLDVNYINKNINDGYVSNIEHIYHTADLDDDSSSSEFKSPVITKISLTSKSNKEFNSLDAVLNLTVEDEDSPRSELKVHMSFASFEQALATSNEAYGENSTFTKDFDFQAMGYSYNDPKLIKLYVVVTDGDGMEARSLLEYDLHRNEPPVISPESKLTKRSEDRVRTGQALLDLIVSDDLDSNNDLLVCYTEDVSALECSNYKKYGELFKNDVYYSFDTTKCNLRGQDKKLKVFVKDSSDRTSSAVLDYKMHNDVSPEIEEGSLEVLSTEPTYNSLNVKVMLKGNDDVSSKSELRVRIVENYKNLVTPYDPNTDQTYPYDENGINYVLSGKYDGTVRPITISLIDECNHESNLIETSYQVYKNQAPAINKLKVTSNGYACKNIENCNPETKGGNVETVVTLDINDDIDNTDSEVLVCVSENRADCNNSNNFKKYYTFGHSFNYTFSKGVDSPYNGLSKNLYVVAKDTYEATSEKSYSYKIYNNEAPTISDFSIISQVEPYTETQSLNVRIFLSADDDMQDMDDLEYSIETEGYEGVVRKSLSEYNESEGIKYRILGTYDGGTRNIIFKVYDKYNKESAPKTTEYTVYKNMPPQIYYVETNGEEQTTVDGKIEIVPNAECKTNYKCPYVDSAEGNNADVSVIFEVRDDIDGVSEIDEDDGFTQGNLKVCLSENETDCCLSKDSLDNCTNPNSNNYVDYNDFLDNDRSFKFNKGLLNPFDGQMHKLYVYVMDSGGLTYHQEKEYQVYKATPPTIIEQQIDEETEEVTAEYPSITSKAQTITDSEGHEKVFNSKSATYNILATDEFEDSVNLTINICYRLVGSGTNYTCNEYPYADSYDIEFPSTSYSGQEYEIYSIVRNSLGLETKSKTITYKLYEDQKPNIYSTSATFNTSDLDNEDKLVIDEEHNESSGGYALASSGDVTNKKHLKVSVIVDDAFDTYQICLSKNSNNCTNYFGNSDGSSFDGSDLNSHWLYFVEPEHLYYYDLDEDDDEKTSGLVTADTYYVFVKDSHGKVSVSDPIKALEYKECSDLELNVNNIDYILDTSVENNHEISGSTCGSKGGQCYYFNPQAEEESDEEIDPSAVVENTSNIIAYYKKRLSYKDRFNSDKICQDKDDNGHLIETAYTANCSFKMCFYNNNQNSYLTKAIGLRKRTLPRDEVETYNYVNPETGEVEVIESQEYYLVYTTRYDVLTDSIILTPTGEHITPDEYNLNPDKFKYNANADIPYVRVID